MTSEIIKPLTDVKEYRYLKLENGLQAIVIHDPRIDLNQGDDEDESGNCDTNDNETDFQSMSEDSCETSQVRRAAVALAVGIGSFSDPSDMQGLSHYLEHMLFMGSSDFPGESEFTDFLTVHSGATNAFTECEMTNYHFEVAPGSLGEALKRFSAFFKAPLCSEAALEKEDALELEEVFQAIPEGVWHAHKGSGACSCAVDMVVNPSH